MDLPLRSIAAVRQREIGSRGACRRARNARHKMLIRVFLGWLRGESRHCKMVAVPTLSQEDAKRPSRERESLVGERTRIINRMKAALIRLGIRDFKPGLLKAPQRLGELRTPEEVPIPPNMLDELRRDMARLGACPCNRQVSLA